MRGLDPRIHQETTLLKMMDYRVSKREAGALRLKPGNDDEEAFCL
jgi:hypothetical protein